MQPLVHGGDIYSAAEACQIPPLDFSANINPLGMPPAVTEAAAASLRRSAAYPDPLCRQLVRALAAYEQVPAPWIGCGNGAADLIFRFAYALRPRKALLTAPTFAEYEQALLAAGCTEITFHTLTVQNDFRLGESFLERIEEDTDLVILCNPNNPTGQLIDGELLREILQRCRRLGTWLMVDECFMEFADEPEKQSLKAYLRDYDKLFLLKAFTKIYAMAGLRLGYGLCSNETFWEKLHGCGQPWGVSVPAQAAGIQALKETAYVEETRRLIRQQRAFLTEALGHLGCQVLAGAANYLLFRLPGVTDLRQRLAEEHILIRSCGNYRGLTEDYYRIAVRTLEENQRLVEGLEKVLSTQAAAI